MREKVDADLYEFLRNNECHVDLRNDVLEAYVCINFYNLNEFAKIVGPSYFDDGGPDAVLHESYVSIDLIDLIENYFGEYIYNYKNCFEENEHKFFEVVSK